MFNQKRINKTAALGCVIIVLTLPACSSLWKARESVVFQRDTVSVHHRDTVFTRDSVYIREWVRGDTVYVDRFRDRYVYRDRWRDSVRVQEVHDTTAIEVKVYKPLSVIQKAKIGAFWPLCGAVILLFAWIFRKPLLSIIKKLLKL